MTDKVIENNQVTIMGEIVSDFTYSHEIFGEGFYMVDVEVQRLSDSCDIIPLMVSERLLDVEEDLRGVKIAVVGQFRSYNTYENQRSRLVLTVFALSTLILSIFALNVDALFFIKQSSFIMFLQIGHIFIRSPLCLLYHLFNLLSILFLKFFYFFYLLIRVV